MQGPTKEAPMGEKLWLRQYRESPHAPNRHIDVMSTQKANTLMRYNWSRNQSSEIRRRLLIAAANV